MSSEDAIKALKKRYYNYVSYGEISEEEFQIMFKVLEDLEEEMFNGESDNN